MCCFVTRARQVLEKGRSPEAEAYRLEIQAGLIRKRVPGYRSPVPADARASGLEWPVLRAVVRAAAGPSLVAAAREYSEGQRAAERSRGGAGRASGE